MTVKELKKAIENLPDEMQIIIQKDREGNGYSPLDGIDSEAIYVPDTTYSGIVYNVNWTASDACLDDHHWNELKKQPRVLVLYPIN